jgi:hypothetical protein
VYLTLVGGMGWDGMGWDRLIDIGSLLSATTLLYFTLLYFTLVLCCGDVVFVVFVDVVVVPALPL